MFHFSSRYRFLLFVRPLHNGLGKYFWTDEAHFHLEGSVNVRFRLKQATLDPRNSVTFPKSDGIEWICSIVYFGLVVLREVNLNRSRDMHDHREAIYIAVRERNCSGSVSMSVPSCPIFIQEWVPPHNACCFKNVLKSHLTEERLISLHFRHVCPA
ncbi:hypothetical protein AVEN_126063-1 [Araneus ventricosus]|uniref:Uncharacterized protein n=1 Tax=Araneus ventricosus TaxID=182803 RepID=A0A4Y2EUX7_ARAVE|nr:hypothetical protein AVEN_126063-1 [Araneus ventricosus]